jgi:HPt (histidine-containing phosphotransfer) domain-containing protein
MPQTQDSAAPAEDRVRHVLLAETSPTVALFVRTLLERGGFTVRLAGADGTALAGQGYDLAVIGGAVPGAGVLAAACAEQAIPVLAIVSGGVPLAGAAAEVAIPVNVAAFHAAVQHCLEQGKAQAMAAAGIDADAIFALWGPNNASFLRVVSMFISEFAECLADIQVLLGRDDRAGIERQAHSIKGAASNVGATAIQAAALELETQALTGSPGELAALAAGLQTAAGPGIACLQALVRAGED